ncbi:MAG TPA: thiamine pyrophosphate-dependent dehydrogenase E1 component subunit alpha [Terriglobia bacterium]|nr:thiamine pyrophosphate-dependent dehydrogenase E1 component subunit alpha [Terriglobia bacterium]
MQTADTNATSRPTVELGVLLQWFEQMLTIRAFEESAIELFGKGMISGSTHPAIAAEAVAVGACSALRPEDLVLATYRGHGVCIAKGSDPKALMAEVLGRVTGCCKGKGGSMHLCDVGRGILGTNAIVAAHIPIAGGVALASKLRHTGQVTLCFFGDGASCEGEFFETLNMAALWKVPLVLVCENNEYAISVPINKSQATPDIADRALGFGMRNIKLDGNDVLAVHEAVSSAASYAREGKGPTLIECKTVRWERHSAFSAGRNDNPEAAQRWRRADPIPRFRALLIGLGAEESQLQGREQRAAGIVHEAVEFALASPRPSEASLSEDVFAQ